MSGEDKLKAGDAAGHEGGMGQGGGDGFGNGETETEIQDVFQRQNRPYASSDWMSAAPLTGIGNLG